MRKRKVRRNDGDDDDDDDDNNNDEKRKSEFARLRHLTIICPHSEVVIIIGRGMGKKWEGRSGL